MRMRFVCFEDLKWVYFSDKVEDIRAMNKEHREAQIIDDKLYAHQRGTLRFQEMRKV